jgi:hypothetical protein
MTACEFRTRLLPVSRSRAIGPCCVLSKDRAERSAPLGSDGDQLLRCGRCQPQPFARKRVDPLWIGKRGLPESKLPIPALERRPLGLEFLNPIAVPHTSEMFESVEQANQKNQHAQREQTVTFTTFLPVDLTAQPRVVNAFHEVAVRETGAARGRLIPRTPLGLGSW